MLSFFNNFLPGNHIPDDIQKSIIIPILKPNKKGLSHKDFRPITFSLCIIKQLETMTANRLTWILENKKEFNDPQIGFRKGRGWGFNEAVSLLIGNLLLNLLHY